MKKRVKVEYLKGPAKGQEKEVFESVAKILSKSGMLRIIPKKELKQEAETKELKVKHQTKKK